MSEEVTTDHNWQILQRFLKFQRINIHQLNDKELLAVSHYNKGAFTDTNQIKSLWRYNFHTDKWIKWHNYPDNIHSFKWSTSALNNDKTKLYIFGDPGYVTTVDLVTGKFMQSSREFHDGAHTRCLWYNGQFHVFGGWNVENRALYVWNEKKQNLMEIHKYDCHAYNLMYISSTKSALMIDPSHGLFLYSLITNKCDRIKIVNDDTFNWFIVNKAVLTKNEQYVVMFLDDVYDITVLDLNTMKIGKSALKAPVSTVNNLIIRDDIYKQQYLSFGYIRNEKLEIPNDIVRIIACYVKFEILHILNPSGHWSVDVEKITTNISFK